MKSKLSPEEFDIVDVIKSEIRQVESTLERVEEFYKKDLRWLDRLSDRIAEIGGSWAFIGSFLLFILAWIVLNSYILVEKPFDTYPYVLLNLILSMVAAIQAPVILMSQSRAARREQTRLEMDLEKDLRDLHVDQGSHRLLLELKKDVEKIKRKLKIN